MDGCQICGTSDLMTACSDDGVCSVCTMRFLGGGSPRPGAIQKIRERLRLSDGEFFQQDHAAEAAKILGRLAP